MLTCDDDWANSSGEQSARAEDKNLRSEMTKSNQVRNEGHVIGAVERSGS
jgi:hypothetical protein